MAQSLQPKCLIGKTYMVVQWQLISFGMQAFTWDINDSMYSDELTGEAADPLAPVPKAPVMRSSSEMSDQVQQMSGNEGRRGSAMSAQVSLPDDPGSNRASLMGSGGG